MVFRSRLALYHDHRVDIVVREHCPSPCTLRETSKKVGSGQAHPLKPLKTPTIVVNAAAKVMGYPGREHFEIQG